MRSVPPRNPTAATPHWWPRFPSRRFQTLFASYLVSFIAFASDRDLEIEHQFEKATDFLFEVKLHAKIDVKRKSCKADGRILLEGNSVILWDCKSVEKDVNLQSHLEEQFDQYLRRERELGNNPIAFLVIGPGFTKQSVKLANQYKARTNWDVAMIKADALKYLADQWAASEPEKAFPIRLLNRTEVIDKDRAEFLLSLA